MATIPYKKIAIGAALLLVAGVVVWLVLPGRPATVVSPSAGSSSASGAAISSDGQEELRQQLTNLYHTDQDLDGLNDAQEKQSQTNPRQADTDEDGLLDNDELAYGTDPRRADTDGDGLSDGTEVRHGSDPSHSTP